MRIILQILLFLFALPGVMLVQAQTVRISGKVTDVEGMSLPGVTIAIKGTAIGTITDVNGDYTLSNVETGSTLVFSFIGMESKEVRVTDQTIINVFLEEEVMDLEEVVVIGYGVQRKESVVSAIDQVTGAELQSMGNPSISSALSGLSPGMNVIVQSGQPGREAGQIFIRGRSDFSNDQALVLVDGVEQVVDLNSFDPSEVESISILKDAAATAVYGVKGANGVVIITTKRGARQRPQINYNSEVTLKRTTFQPDMLNSYEANKLLSMGRKNDQMWGSLITDQELEFYRDQSLPYFYPDVDWWSEMIKDNTFSQRHTLSLNGGNDFVKYFTSINYLDEGDIYRVRTEPWMDFDPTHSFERISLRSNLDFQLTKTTELRSSLSGQVGYSNSSSGGTNWGLFEALYLLPNSAYPLLYPAEALQQFPDIETDPYMDNPNKTWRRSYDKFYNAVGQPFNQLHSGQVVNKMNSLSADFELVQKLDNLVKGLDIRAKYNYSRSFSFNQSYNLGTANSTTRPIVYLLYLRDPSDMSSYVWERSDLSDANLQESTNTFVSNMNLSNKREVDYFRLQMNYDRTFGAHEVTGMGLFSRRKETIMFGFPYYNEDWVGRFTYNYKYKYFLELTGAYNGDESFEAGYKFRFFPAFAAGYNIAREDFVERNFSWLSSLRVRYSYGQAGSASGAPRWGYFGEYGTLRQSSNTYGNSRYFPSWQFGTTFDRGLYDVLGPVSLASSGATWAVTTKQNIGLDFGFFDDKISGNIEFFEDYREGIFIHPQSIPGYIGLTVTPPRVGIGEIKKHGYEFSLRYRDRTSWGLRYSIGGAFGFNENRVVFNDDLLKAPEYQKTEGKPISTTTVYQVNGFFQSIDEIVNYAPFVSHSNPNLGDVKPIDYNADGIIDNNDRVKLDLNEVPLNNFSATLTAEYRGFSARVFVTGVYNYNMVEGVNYAYPLTSGYAVGREDQLDFWTHSNTNASYPSLHANPDNYTRLVGANSQRVINMSYVRLKNVELAYSFKPSSIMTISNIQLYLNGNNLYTLTDFAYGDPEGKNVGAGAADYPMLQRYNVGIRVAF